MDLIGNWRVYVPLVVLGSAIGAYVGVHNFGVLAGVILAFVGASAVNAVWVTINLLRR